MAPHAKTLNMEISTFSVFAIAAPGRYSIYMLFLKPRRQP